MEIHSQQTYRRTPASRGKRILAYIIDVLPITLFAWFLAHLFFNMADLAAAAEAPSATVDDKLAFSFARWVTRMIAYSIWILYSFLLDNSPMQGTLGKRLLGIKVVNLQGQPLGWKQSLIRNLGKWMGLILFISFLWVLFDRNRQALHDKIAKTLVVER